MADDRASRQMTAPASSELAEASPSATASTTTAPGESSSEALGPRVRRRQGIAEAGREVTNREARRSRPEVGRRRDPVDRARVVDRFWHVDVCGLEHPLGDPERDPVHEIALPQLERGRRRLLETREVREVPPESCPALRFGLGTRRPPAPQATGEDERSGEEDRVHEQAEADGHEDDIHQVWVFRPVAENLEIDMSAVGKIETLPDKINEELEKVENYNEYVNYILRINLTGRTGLHKSINVKAEIDDLVEFLNGGQLNQQYFRWIDQVYVNTRPDIDIEKIKNGTGFSAEILKNFDTYLEDDNKLTELINNADEDFVNAQARKEAGDFTENTKKAILEKARMILLDKLTNEE